VTRGVRGVELPGCLAEVERWQEVRVAQADDDLDL
jgi:hypothetical protein